MDEMHKHIQKFKLDLKNYYNSAFFKDDSKMVKELHKTIVGTETPKEDWVTETSNLDGYGPLDLNSHPTQAHSLLTGTL